MFVRAQVEFATHASATLVPFSAVVRRAGREGVFVVAASAASDPPAQEAAAQARFVPVTVGIASGETVEIVAPEVSGSVVTLGNHLLEDGARILLPQPRPAGEGEKKGSLRSSNSAGSPPSGGAR